MSLLFNMLSRFVIALLPRSKCLLISWLQSPPAMILERPKIKSVTDSTVSPSICHEVMGLKATILVFWMLSSTPTFSLSPFTFIKRLFSSLLSAIRVVSSVYLIKTLFCCTIKQVFYKLLFLKTELFYWSILHLSITKPFWWQKNFQKTLNTCNVPFILKHVPLWIKNYIFTLLPKKCINTPLKKTASLVTTFEKALAQ